jgi:hypothetical protein
MNPTSPQQPTIGGLADFIKSPDFLDARTDRRPQSSLATATRRVLNNCGEAPDTILTGPLIDEIVKAYWERRYSLPLHYNTVRSYCSGFRTTAIAYKRWVDGDPHFWEFRTTRTINPCDEHTTPTTYGDNALQTVHVPLDDGPEATIKVPTSISPDDADRLIKAIRERTT